MSSSAPRPHQHTILDQFTPQAQTIRVLVVDDNADAADTLAALLSILDCTVAVAYSGSQALAIGELFHPQCVILDIGMPGIDGYETARRMRARPWGRHTRIAALTACVAEDVDRRVEQAGMDRYFIKPVDAAALLGFLTGASS